MARDTSVLTIPNDTSYLPIVGAYVMAVAAQLGFDEADVADVRSAVDEACTHVIETAFEPGEEQTFAISCQRYPSGLKVTVADKGLPFDPRSIEEYDAHGGLDRKLGGLSLCFRHNRRPRFRLCSRRHISWLSQSSKSNDSCPDSNLSIRRRIRRHTYPRPLLPGSIPFSRMIDMQRLWSETTGCRP